MISISLFALVLMTAGLGADSGTLALSPTRAFEIIVVPSQADKTTEKVRGTAVVSDLQNGWIQVAVEGLQLRIKAGPELPIPLKTGDRLVISATRQPIRQNSVWDVTVFDSSKKLVLAFLHQKSTLTGWKVSEEEEYSTVKLFDELRHLHRIHFQWGHLAASTQNWQWVQIGEYRVSGESVTRDVLPSGSTVPPDWYEHWLDFVVVRVPSPIGK